MCESRFWQTPTVGAYHHVYTDHCLLVVPTEGCHMQYEMTTIFRFQPTGSFITVGIHQPENMRRNDIYLTPHLADNN